MDLFSKILRFFFGRRMLFSQRDMVFNRGKLEGDIVKHSAMLYDYRTDQSHKVFSEYLRSLLNLEILKLSEVKLTTPETFAYQRGRIEGLRHALDLREKFIQDKKVAKETGQEESKRSYVRQPATSAGLAI